MQNFSNYQNVICIYKITCLVNGKILIGSTTNLYNRVCHYRTDMNKPNPLKHYNKIFYNDLIEYGLSSFVVDIVESYNNISDKDLKNKETYFMNLYDSINPNKGYNIRQDIDGHCICADSTREIKRKQTSEQWKLGLRAGHSDKLKNYWKDNDDRRKQQSSIMSANKTKYTYEVYNLKTKELKTNISYNELDIPNYPKEKILQKFCRVNNKPITKKVIILYGNDIESYRNTIIVGEYRIRRNKI